MGIFKKTLRIVWLAFLIILALSGVAIGVALYPRKERDFDQEVKIELVEGELDDNLTKIRGEKSQE